MKRALLNLAIFYYVISIPIVCGFACFEWADHQRSTPLFAVLLVGIPSLIAQVIVLIEIKKFIQLEKTWRKAEQVERVAKIRGVFSSDGGNQIKRRHSEKDRIADIFP